MVIKLKTIRNFFMIMTLVGFALAIGNEVTADWLLDRLYGSVVVIDPGHGGVDGGTSANGILEKDVNLAIGLRLEAILREHNCNVYMTRHNDVSLEKAGPPGTSRHRRDLGARVGLGRWQKCDAFVSIHMNYARSSSLKGPVVFFGPNDEMGRSLAEKLLTQLETVLGKSPEGCLERKFYVLDKLEYPAVLVEVGFFSNMSDFLNVNNEQYQDKIAQALARGIADFIKDTDDRRDHGQPSRFRD